MAASCSDSSSDPHAGPHSRFQQSRRKRWESSTRTLFHQTDSDSAQKIVGSQEFRRGDPNSLAGSGIYFAVSPEDTDHKARKTGPILKATVLLGKVKTISPTGDSSVNFHSLRKEGYDSVKIPSAGGDEYVVYSCEQVRNIRYHFGKSQPAAKSEAVLTAAAAAKERQAPPLAAPTVVKPAPRGNYFSKLQEQQRPTGGGLATLPSHHGPALGI